jgi:hypothetical protein
MLTRCSILVLLIMSVAGCSTPTQSSKRGLSSQLIDQKPETSTTMIAATQEAASVSNLEGNAEDNNMAFDLNTYQWKNRLLLVFAPSENSPAYHRQMQLFQGQQAGFKERDLLLVELLTESTSRAYGQTLDDARARSQSVREARSRFHVAPQDFQVILVGKDGTAKRRESNPIQPEVIFNEIDAMPMRQREMREQSRG